MSDNHFHFIGGNKGKWRILKMEAVVGDSLPLASHLDITQKPALQASDTNAEVSWVLSAFTSNHRYTYREEKDKLVAVQAGLGRAEATCAALIPIRKTEAWWALAQDERQEIFTARSQHTAVGLKYLPAIARKLYHCRDLGQPFDFLTWFEYAPEYATAFEELVVALRSTHEWQYIDREVDFRLQKV